MKRFLPLLLVVASVAGLAQGTLEVISLRYRTADQVIPVLQPLLEPGGALSGQYNQLIVRTSPGNLAQIRAVLDSIDRPPRRLMVSVRFDRAEDTARSSVQTDARVSDRGSSINVRASGSNAATDERVDQRMQVLEGGQAYISTGEARIQGEAASGFAVMPRVSGSTVFLDIATQQEAFSRGGAIQGQRASSTVSGRLGEWIELGGVSVNSASGATSALSSRDRARTEDRRIWLKVEEIR